MTELLTPSLMVVNNQPRALSTDIASFFGKQHQHVMRQIRNIVANCPESFSASNFGLAEISDAQGKPRPAYWLTYDAFSLLTMGFTGPKALKFKLAYINAFNLMRAELAARPEQFALTAENAPKALDAKSTVEDRRPLVNLVNTWIGLDRIGYHDAWHQVNGLFGHHNAKQLTISQVKQACDWVQGKIDVLSQAAPAPSLIEPSTLNLSPGVLDVLWAETASLWTEFESIKQEKEHHRIHCNSLGAKAGSLLEKVSAQAIPAGDASRALCKAIVNPSLVPDYSNLDTISRILHGLDFFKDLYDSFKMAAENKKDRKQFKSQTMLEYCEQSLNSLSARVDNIMNRIEKKHTR